MGSHAFGRGCLEAGPPDRDADDDEVTRLLAAARREAIGLGRRWVDTVHLLLAAVRAGGDVGRVFGMRGVGPAVLLAALDDAEEDTPGAGPGSSDDPTAGDPVRPAVSSVARTVLHRVVHRAAQEGRAVSAAELAVAVARSGRVADLLARLGVDHDELAEALTAGGSAYPSPDAVTTVLRRVPVPVGVVTPVTVILPAVALPGPDPHAADVPA